jgi:hypothetical protein
MDEQIQLKVVEVVGGGLCVASDDGEKVHALVASALRQGKRVVVSFEGVTDLTSAFLNAAIGQLYGEFSEDYIRAGLSVTGASNDDLHILKRVVDRAKQFFKDPAPFREAAKAVLGADSDC